MNSHVNIITIDYPISKVTYGLNDTVIDITERFNKMIHNGSYMQLTNQFAGSDPLYGVVKKLYILLENGKQLSITEGECVIINIMNQSSQIPNIHIMRLCDDENNIECNILLDQSDPTLNQSDLLLLSNIV